MSRRPNLLNVSIRNRQRRRAVNTAMLRRAVQAVLREDLAIAGCTLCFHLVDAPEMTRLNEQFLGHKGSTDVITFDHADSAESSSLGRVPEEGHAPVGTGLPPNLHGEIFISVPDAMRQARAFRTTWQSEIARYAIHGVLHLLGHDDHAPGERRRMKREERRLLNSLRARSPLKQLATVH